VYIFGEERSICASVLWVVMNQSDGIVNPRPHGNIFHDAQFRFILWGEMIQCGSDMAVFVMNSSHS
jgi:hypothetical protein